MEEQKKKADADAKLEEKRSTELKKQRDELSAQAAKKAAEVRKLNIGKQGVFTQLSVIENKKKVLVEIRENVDKRIQELYIQSEKDKETELEKIRNNQWQSIELENGLPTQEAKKRRENKMAEVKENFRNKFQKTSDSVRNSIKKQDEELLAEIRRDMVNLSNQRTVSSLDGELKISYGTYSGQNKGWNAYLSLYSEGELLYEDTFIISYLAI